MVYMGSKNRIAKDIIPIITKDLQPNQWYVEPFVGGCNLIDKIEHPLRLGADNNKYLIALLKYVQDGGELPEFIDKDEYKAVKANPDNYSDWYAGFCGFIASRNGVFFGTYAGICDTQQGQRNYIREKRNNLLRQDLSGISLVCSSYEQLEIPEGSIIYCDPPYKEVTGYKDKFDTEKFWDWVRDKSANGYKVYVSEYEAPEDFKAIWSKELSSSLSGSNKLSKEKLFIRDVGNDRGKNV